jgi:hypothetical protein
MLSQHLETAAARRRELRVHTKLLDCVLGALPPMDDSRLKDAIVNCYDLISFPYDRFRELASEYSSEAGSEAGIVETNVKWLGALFGDARAIPTPESDRRAEFPKGNYDAKLRFAMGALARILAELDSFESTRRRP